MSRLILGRKTRSGLMAFLLAGAALPLATPALAQAADSASTDKVETVIVTAEKRSEPLQKVPVAVTALTQQTLTDMGGSDLADFANVIPGLAFENDRAGENSTTIRGISEIGGIAPSVGIYMDEIPITAVSGEQVNLKSFDVNQIEVLRGPQGTLYGEGSEGGTIRIVTNKPDADAFSAAIRATGSDTDHGGFNDELDAMVNIPIVADTLAVRAVGLWSDYDGWTTNPDLGSNHYNRNVSYTARLEARYTPDSKWTVDLSFIDQYSKSDGPSVSDLDYVYAVPTAEPRNDRFDIYSATVTGDLGFATLTSATGYFDRSSFSHNDFSSEAGLASFIYGTPISTVAARLEPRRPAAMDGRRLLRAQQYLHCEFDGDRSRGAGCVQSERGRHFAPICGVWRGDIFHYRQAAHHGRAALFRTGSKHQLERQRSRAASLHRRELQQSHPDRF
jgi:outer membrane receptor protein involved in Fe transport